MQYLHHSAVVERLKKDDDGYKGDSTVQGTQELLDTCQVSLTSVAERTRGNRLLLSLAYLGDSVLHSPRFYDN